MGTTEGTVESKLVFILGQMSETCPGYDSSHAVPYKINDSSLLVHKGPDVIFNLVC